METGPDHTDNSQYDTNAIKQNELGEGMTLSIHSSPNSVHAHPVLMFMQPNAASTMKKNWCNYLLASVMADIYEGLGELWWELLYGMDSVGFYDEQ